MLRARKRGVHSTTWPGFVDAMTGLLLVLMFVLTIFTVVQFTLRDQISGQQSRLDQLAAEVASLTDALGISQGREAALSDDLAQAQVQGEEQASLIDALTRERDAQAADLSEAQGRITDFEAQVAGLLADRNRSEERIASLEAQTARQVDRAEALNLALASARDEISAGEEQARLAAARREALEMLVRNLQNRTAEQGEALSDAEAQRLTDAAAAQALRERLQNSEAELTAMTLNLEEQRRKAEETLTMLAAAQSARDDLDMQLAAAVLARRQAEQSAQANQASDADLRARLAAALEQVAASEAASGEARSESERQAALLATAQAQLSEKEALSAEGQRQVAALNAQVAELRAQVGTLQALLDVAKEEDAQAQVQIESLGSELNTALARVASEQRRRAELEEAERRRAEDEAAQLAAKAEDLEAYKSEFFGNMRRLLEGRQGIQVVGDRFVFSSEVLFDPGSARLSPEGRAQIARVSSLLREIAVDVPPGIDWVIQVDGHTDDTPLSGGGPFRDNWELSQARALSVVRQMSQVEGIPPERLSANGYGEFQPIDTSGTPEGQARNRRIEIKLTER